MEDLLFSRIEGNGKPLLILHGYLGMSDNWKTLSGRFAEQGFQVHSLDLRNHGRSFHSDDFSQELMVQDVLAYCKYHKLDKINLIGHSMGGKVAMLLATSHSDLVDKLIVVDISVREYPPHHQDILDALNSVDFTIQKDRKDVEEQISKHITDFGVLQFLMKNVHRKSSDELGFRFNLKALTEKYDNMGIALPENSIFNKPVLFIRGGNSNYIRERDIQDILVHFPKAEIKTIENAGHWVHSENPDLFFDFSVEYLND